jgi:uncharacterized protein (DUF2336 family)
MSEKPASKREILGDGFGLYGAVRERLAVAAADLFLPAGLRLAEWHRSTMSALLVRLVRSIEDELRAALAASFPATSHPELNAALAAAHVEIALPILLPSPALRDPDLVALLLRRAEEHRLFRTYHGPAAVPDTIVRELVQDPDALLAESAMAVLVGRSRRLDRFEEPVIASPELPAEIEHRLVWTVAAALRSYLLERHAIVPSGADAVLTAAVAARLAAHDESESLEARCLMLVRHLDRLDRLGTLFIARSLEGGLSLLLAAVAVRCGLTADSAWEILSDPENRGAALLLRAAGLGRAEAGPILFALSGMVGTNDEEELAGQIDLLDTLGGEEARAALDIWRIDPAYRAAIAAVGASGPHAVAR